MPAVHEPDRPRPDPREFPLEPDEPPALRLEPGPGPQAQRFFAALLARWRTYAVIVGTATVVAAGISLVLPSWYRTKSTLLPPSDTGESGFGMLQGMIQSNALSTLGFKTTSTPSDVFGEILKSRLLSEAAINRFGYSKLYKKKGMDRTVKEFQRHLAVKVNAAGILDVSFEDRDPQRAADVTNFLVSGLDHFNVETYKTRGKRLRQFLEALEHQRKPARVRFIPINRSGAGGAHFTDVGAGAEHRARTRQQHDARGRVARERCERLGETGDEFRGQGVPRLRSIKGERDDAAGVAFDSKHGRHIRNTP